MKNVLFILLVTLLMNNTSKAQLSVPVDNHALLKSKNEGTEYDFIRYFLPEKVFYITLTYTKVSTKITDKKGNILQEKTVIKQLDPVTVESKIIPGNLSYGLDLTGFNSGGRSYSAELVFDDNGCGILTSINGSQEPVSSEIIKGTFSIINAVAKIAAISGISGLAPSRTKNVYDTAKIEQKITEKSTLLVRSKLKDTSFTLFTFDTEDPSKPLTVTLNLQKIKSPSSVKSVAPINDDVPGIMYRIPAKFQMDVVVENYMLAERNAIISEIVFIPQCGKLSYIPFPIRKGKKTIQVSFNPSNGNLSKYSIKKESTVKTSMADIKSSVDDLSGSLNNVMKTKEDKNYEALEQEAKFLKLEKDILQLKSDKKKILAEDMEQ